MESSAGTHKVSRKLAWHHLFVYYTNDTTVSMARFSSWIERSYGRDLVQDRSLTTAFVAAFPITVLMLYFIEPSAVTLTIILSISIGILGVYIAVWAYNREHVKTIEDRYLHKASMCVAVNHILVDIDNFNNNMKKSPEMYQKHRKWLMVRYHSNEGMIRSINSSIFVPYQIKNTVNSLLFNIIGSITDSFNHSQIHGITLKPLVWINMGDLFHSDYFRYDGSDEVRNLLTTLKNTWQNINNQ